MLGPDVGLNELMTGWVDGRGTPIRNVRGFEVPPCEIQILTTPGRSTK
jgi:hypothetical protein